MPGYRPIGAPQSPFCTLNVFYMLSAKIAPGAVRRFQDGRVNRSRSDRNELVSAAGIGRGWGPRMGSEAGPADRIPVNEPCSG